MLTDDSNSDTTPTHISNSYSEPSSPSSVSSMDGDEDAMGGVNLNQGPPQGQPDAEMPQAAAGAPPPAAGAPPPAAAQPTPPSPSPDSASQAAQKARDRLLAVHHQAMADAERNLADLRLQQANLERQNDEAQRLLDDAVARAAQHTRDLQAERAVHADMAKRMVHAPTSNVDTLLDLSQTVSPEVQIGLYLSWSTSLTDMLQGKSYGSEIESWMKAQVSPDDHYTKGVMSGFFTETPVTANFQRFRSAIDLLQRFFQKRFTTFDVPMEIASFLRSLKVNYKSKTKNYTVAPTCSVLAQRVLRVVQFRDTDADGTTTFPDDIVTLIMTALPVANRQQIYRDQAQHSAKYDTYDKLQTRLCIADEEYHRANPPDFRHPQVPKPVPAAPSQPSEPRSHGGGGRGRRGGRGARSSGRGNYHNNNDTNRHNFDRLLADPAKYQADANGFIKKCNFCNKLGHTEQNCFQKAKTNGPKRPFQHPNNQRNAENPKKKPHHALNSAQQVSDQQAEIESATKLLQQHGYKIA